MLAPILQNLYFCSALSLRLFGEDITKEAKTGKVIENEVEQKLVD